MFIALYKIKGATSKQLSNQNERNIFSPIHETYMFRIGSQFIKWICLVVTLGWKFRHEKMIYNVKTKYKSSNKFLYKVKNKGQLIKEGVHSHSTVCSRENLDSNSTMRVRIILEHTTQCITHPLRSFGNSTTMSNEHITNKRFHVMSIESQVWTCLGWNFLSPNTVAAHSLATRNAILKEFDRVSVKIERRPANI